MEETIKNIVEAAAEPIEDAAYIFETLVASLGRWYSKAAYVDVEEPEEVMEKLDSFPGSTKENF